VKAFVIYTAMRLALFVVCYAVLGGLYLAVFGETDGALLWPFIAAVVVSSLLSLRLLAPQRERFAQVVEARATKATTNFEKRRAREDVD
jgi:hypothetical protein